MPDIFMIAPKTTPELAIALAQHLTSAYPLTNTKRLAWEFHQKDNVCKGAIGFAQAGEYNNKKYTTLKIGMGKTKPRTLEQILFTTAHEYMHARQYDRDLSRTGPTTQSEEDEADRFAHHLVASFLKD